jgi:hypothetical protein
MFRDRLNLPCLETLFSKLRRLAHADTQLRIFGASAHEWSAYQLPSEELDAAMVRYGVDSVPEAWRWWVTEGPGTGPGPFYGLIHPDDVEPAEGELEGAIPLSDHGCGFTDWLMTDAERAGQVWVDFREAGGEVVLWYPSFESWFDAWLDRSMAEWGIEYLDEGVPRDDDFMAAAQKALLRVVSQPEDPILQQYPLPIDRAYICLGQLALLDGQNEKASEAFQAASAASKEPDAMRALGECYTAQAQGDAEAHLRAADEGLRSEQLWWITNGKLLIHRAKALEALQRWDELTSAQEDVEKHYHRA